MTNQDYFCRFYSRNARINSRIVPLAGLLVFAIATGAFAADTAASSSTVGIAHVRNYAGPQDPQEPVVDEVQVVAMDSRWRRCFERLFGNAEAEVYCPPDGQSNQTQDTQTNTDIPLVPQQQQETTSVIRGVGSNMIGDFFGGISSTRGTVFDTSTVIPTPGTGGGVGVVKFAENTSPIPRDRVFFNYSFFDNVPLQAGQGVPVNRFSPGFEKTFFDGAASIEFRAPFAATRSGDITNVAGVSTNSSNVQFGNLTTYAKFVFHETDTFALTGGLGATAPTAPDTTVQASGVEAVRIKNESVHLLPFIGTLWAPSERSFVQSLLQIDVDASGSPVIADAGGGPQNLGRQRDITFLYYGVSAGYWVYLNDSSDSFFSGIAPIAELHVNQSLDNNNSFTMTGPSGVINVGNNPGSITLVNATVGLNVRMAQSSLLTLAYVTPIGGGADQPFDGEFRAMYNWYFGRSSRSNFGQFSR